MTIVTLCEELQLPSDALPVWGDLPSMMRSVWPSSLEMLHGLHHVCLYISDVLYGEEKLSDSGVHPDTQMLATYICEFANWIWCLQNAFTHLY